MGFPQSLQCITSAWKLPDENDVICKKMDETGVHQMKKRNLDSEREKEAARFTLKGRIQTQKYNLRHKSRRDTVLEEERYSRKGRRHEKARGDGI